MTREEVRVEKGFATRKTSWDWDPNGGGIWTDNQVSLSSMCLRFSTCVLRGTQEVSTRRSRRLIQTEGYNSPITVRRSRRGVLEV